MRARIPAEDTTSFTNTAVERVSFANARIRTDVATFAATSRRLSTAKNTLVQMDSKATSESDSARVIPYRTRTIRVPARR
jgi:hypothetical protein